MLAAAEMSAIYIQRMAVIVHLFGSNLLEDCIDAVICGTQLIALLYNCAVVIREAFTRGNIPPTDSRPFQSHLTVAKTRNARHTPISPDTYSAFVGEEFGEQEVEGLELLSMSMPADEDGYYHCFAKCPFVEK